MADMDMVSVGQAGTGPEFCACFSAEYFEPKWYAIYTSAHHEKQVAAKLRGRSVEFFLPLHETVHCWKNRRAKVVLPLFPGYLFVRIPLKDRLKVLEVAGVVRLISFAGRPIPLPEEEVRAMQQGVRERGATPHRYLPVGRKVRIKRGPFASLEGVLIRRKNNFRVAVSLHSIMRSFLVEVESGDLEPLG